VSPINEQAPEGSSGPSEVKTADFYPEQVRRLYSFLPVGLVASAVNSVILAAVLWPVLPHRSLIIWLVSLLTVTTGRFVLVRLYNGAPESRKSDRIWGRLLIAGNFLSGVLWGCLVIFLFPVQSMPHQVFEAFVIGGMVAGAVSTFSNLRRAFVAFALPASVPVTVRFFTFWDGMHIAMAAMCSVFVVLMFISAFRNHKAYRAVLELNVENRLLIDRLSEKSTKAEQVTEELRNLTAYLDSVREEESKRIASEIHDQLGQSLTAAKMALARLRNSWPEPPEDVRGNLYSVSTLLETVIGDVRRIARHLRPLVLDELGLGAAVEWLVDDFRERTSAVCDLELRIEDQNLDSDCSVALFRILQEALTNVARHAEAKRVRVVLIEREEEILLRIEDDGKGISPDYLRSHAFGVLSMKERALRLGGEFQISPAEPTGTVVSLRIPRGRHEA
jgi:signal transduction histidine kinase